MTFTPTDNPETFGHNLIVGISGPSLSDDDKRMLAEVKPVGIMLLDRNFLQDKSYDVWLPALDNLLKEIRDYSEREKMLVTVDAEGGRVHRTPEPISRFPYAMKYRKYAGDVAKTIGAELSSIGVNFNFAPVVDIHSNPDNPVIGERAFGKTVEEVISASFEFVDGLVDQKIIPCIKHFPGHGDTATDSHFELPVINQSLEMLEARELEPFRAHIERGIPAVMSAHVMFTAIDPDYPATMSEKILGGILRERLEFEGVIISDDLEMSAISSALKDDELAARCFNAGCDLFIVSMYNQNSSSLSARELASRFARGIKTRAIAESACIDKFDRVNELLGQAAESKTFKLEDEILATHKELVQEVSS